MLKVLQGEYPQWPLIGKARGLPNNLPTERNFEVVRQWIDECTQNHPECTNTKVTPLPTRVIDVVSNRKEPYVYLTKGENARYVALSHCWGPAESNNKYLVTTKNSLEQHRLGISLASFFLKLFKTLSVSLACWGFNTSGLTRCALSRMILGIGRGRQQE